MDSYQINPDGTPPPRFDRDGIGNRLKHFLAALGTLFISQIYDQIFEAMGLKATALYLAITSTVITVFVVILIKRQRPHPQSGREPSAQGQQAMTSPTPQNPAPRGEDLA